jgi:hypothetical protein
MRPGLQHVSSAASSVSRLAPRHTPPPSLSLGGFTGALTRDEADVSEHAGATFSSLIEAELARTVRVQGGGSRPADVPFAFTPPAGRLFGVEAK